VSTDNGNGLLRGVGTLDLRDEAGSTDDIKGGNTEEALGVVDASGLENLRDDGYGGVDLKVSARVPYLRVPMMHTGLEMTRMLASGEALAAALARSRTMEALVLKRSVKRSVPIRNYLFTVILLTVTGHAGLTGNTGRNEDDLGALEGIGKAALSRLVALNGAVSVDVADISSDT
jgi:hypothetical protein